MHLPRSKPKPANWKVVLTSAIVVSSLLFPLNAVAVESSPTPSPTASISPSPSASNSPSPIASPDPMQPVYDIDTASSLTVVVNKKRPLNPITYKPVLRKIGNIYVAKPVKAAFDKLKAAVQAKNLGTLCINSGYRGYEYQAYLHSSRVKQLGQVDGERLTARPGYSEHQTGLAIDISTTALGCRIGSFGASSASKWIAANAWQYGFIVRYPSKSTTKITGYVWEPWHLRYVGLDLAADMQAKNIKTLEQYFALPKAAKY